jgi:hypothetical protein
METKSKQFIRLKSVTTEKNTDYYPEVKSEAKAMKEAGMNPDSYRENKGLKKCCNEYINLYTAKEALNKQIKYTGALAGPKNGIHLYNNIILLGYR